MKALLTQPATEWKFGALAYAAYSAADAMLAERAK
jgi:hypothetical protein